MPIVYVKPCDGGRVRMPERNFAPMPAEGANVERDGDYYNRLIVAGDLVIIEPPSAPDVTADVAEFAPEPQPDAPAKRTSKEK
jgi:hypothetical protein